MKKIIFFILGILCLQPSHAAIHVIKVWSGYYAFLPNSITIQLGDTIHWLPLDPPTMSHTITSTTIPAGATAFDVMWQLPADTFFQYIPLVAGIYNYECTPHSVSNGMNGTFQVDSVISGVNDGISSMQQVKVFPNPSNGKFKFEISNQQLTAEKIDLEIYNTLGEKIISKSLSNKTTVLDLSSYPAGIYFYKVIEHNNKITTGKIIKQ